MMEFEEKTNKFFQYSLLEVLYSTVYYRLSMSHSPTFYQFRSHPFDAISLTLLQD